MKKLLWGLILVLGLAYAGAEFAAQKYAEDAIEASVQKSGASMQDVQADVSFPLILGVLASSEVQNVEVRVAHVPAGPIISEELVAQMHRVKLDVGSSIRRREPVLDSIESIDFTIKISDIEISKLLPEGFSITFEETTARILGPGIDIRADVSIENGAMRFHPKGDEARIPIPNVELPDVPFIPCPAAAVALEPEFASITCTVKNPPAQFPGA